MKQAGPLLLILALWIGYTMGKSAGRTEILSAPPYPGAASPGY